MSDDSSLISRLRRMSGAPIGKQAGSNNQQSANLEEPAERCDFCSKAIPSDHRHFADLQNMKFMCACEMCTVLQAEKDEYHPIPQRYKYLEGFEMSDMIWNELKIPVNMAFVVYNSEREQSIAFYPSPAGAMESELRLESWDSLKEKNPILEHLVPDLEGFMVNRLDNPHEYFIAPIDKCYELIGLIRMTWQGMSGGEKMRETVREFYKHLKQESD